MLPAACLGRVIGLENDDDDRRDDQNQSGCGVEVEAFAEVDDTDQYGRQGFHRAEDRSHRRADMLDRQHQRQVGEHRREQGQQQQVRQMCHVDYRDAGRREGVDQKHRGGEGQHVERHDQRVEPSGAALHHPMIYTA